MSASDFECSYPVTTSDFEDTHSVAHKSGEHFHFDLLRNYVACAGPLAESGPAVPKGEYVASALSFCLHVNLSFILVRGRHKSRTLRDPRPTHLQACVRNRCDFC